MESGVSGTRLLDELYRLGLLYKKAEVMLSGIEPSSQVQPDLFIAGQTSRRDQLMQALDGISSKFGRGAVHLAVEDVSADWKMSRGMLSPWLGQLVRVSC